MCSYEIATGSDCLGRGKRGEGDIVLNVVTSVGWVNSRTSFSQRRVIDRETDQPRERRRSVV